MIQVSQKEIYGLWHSTCSYPDCAGAAVLGVRATNTVPECRHEYDGMKQARSVFALKGIQT